MDNLGAFEGNGESKNSISRRVGSNHRPAVYELSQTTLKTGALRRIIESQGSPSQFHGMAN